MLHADGSVHPARNQRLQACLAAEMLHIGIVSGHVFPRIDLQDRMFDSIWIGRPIALDPCQPPMVDAALLLAADFTMKRLSPSHETGPTVWKGKGSLARKLLLFGSKWSAVTPPQPHRLDHR